MTTATKKIVTFGEVLMRLSPPENRKLMQANQLDFFFGGTEMNVAASLAYLGESATHITAVSNDLVGEAAIASLRHYGIDVSEIKKVAHPLGIYFLEVGSMMRSGKITYNRLHGAFANISPDIVDWEKALEGADLLHWTGISPAISEKAYQTLKAGLIAARARGIQVTVDPTYRSNLWHYGRNGREVLEELVSLSTVFIGGVNEINAIMDISFGLDEKGFRDACIYLMDKYPCITRVFDKIRTGLSASWQKVYGQAWTGDNYIKTPEYEMTQVIDRIGTGDAFAAGIIYGLKHYDDEKTLQFATASCALKHTILGDVNLVSVDDILEVLNGNTSGRIKR